MMRWLWLLPILVSGGYAGAAGAVGVYGRPVPYALHQAVQYPDFSVRFLGTRREVISVYPRGFLYYDFEIFSRAQEKTTVSWTSGTGSLGPHAFEVDGKGFFLELKANSLETDARKRWLKENEMIIWKREDYLEKQGSR